MALENQTIALIPVDLEDQIALRNFLQLLVQQIDTVIGLRVTEVSLSYDKVEPSAAYIQSEATSVADDLKALYDRVEALEARLVPINN